MKINNLRLTNFRNYENLNIYFDNFLNCLYGFNGSGKTNLIEAIYMLSLTKSFRINNDKCMIKKGKIKAKVEGEIESNKELTNYKLEIKDEGKLVYINDQKCEKISDYISRVNVVLFNPSDTRIIDDAPVERRKLLNVEISQLYKEYLIILTNYNKILKQRNFYLRSLYINGNNTTDYLDILTMKLIEYGLLIYKYRSRFIEEINEFIADIYQKIFGSGVLKIRYVSSFKNKDKETLLKKYQTNYSKELSVGKTIDGIHHDDMWFILDNNNLKEWGSEGQRKNAVISFKLAEINVIKRIKQEYPILILDDLFSELDPEKVNNLLKVLNQEVQTFITCTSVTQYEEALTKAKKIKVNDGVVEEDNI